ncbi:MAG: chemotaxis protein MotB [Alphaproteobacteria bacterium]|nr:chemotaxis protein MotB [Alphaproteobacteria bacterium]
MGDSGAIAPIIIKRKKVIVAGGHHGGAWKVAYADFVTAMMAFFLLMWLLNATTESQRKGIADYFSPTIPINRISGGGEGMFGGDSVFSEETLPQNGTGGSDSKPSEEQQAKGNSGVETRAEEKARAQEEKEMQALAAQLNGSAGESSIGEPTLEHIFPRVTDEGLIVEIFDLPDEPLFVGEGEDPSLILRQLIAMIARLLGPTENQIAVNGFTQSFAVVRVENPGWDRSLKRAQKVRQMLEIGGLSPDRMERVAGWSDRRPSVENPMAARNNRFEIILLRRDRAATGK